MTLFRTFIRFAVCWIYTLLVSTGTCLIMVCGFRKLAWIATCKPWARGALRVLGIHLDVKGGENLAGPALFASNHQSLIDVIFLPSVLPRRVKWIAKKELLRIPLWGWGFGSAGAVFIDRAKPTEAVATIREGIDGLPADWSIVIFPEGTRSRDGALGSLKKGAVHVALQSRLPIVPIGMWGAHDLMPKNTWLARTGVVKLTVGQRISTDHWQTERIEEHLTEVRDAIQDCVSDARRRHMRERSAERPSEVG